METLKNFAVMLLFISAAGFIYCLLLPNGRISNVAKSVLASVFLLLALSPLFAFMGQRLPSLETPRQEAYTEHGDIYLSAVETVLRREVENAVKAYTDLPFEILLQVNITDDYNINIDQVRLLFPYQPAEREALINAVYNAVGIRPVLDVREDQ